MVDGNGVPLAVELTPANAHECNMLQPMLDKIPCIRRPRGRPRRKPQKLHADKAYDHVFCRAGCRVRGIVPRIARRGIESRERLGRHRWVVERSFAWLHAFRRLATRYERRADIHRAFLSLGASLIRLAGKNNDSECRDPYGTALDTRPDEPSVTRQSHQRGTPPPSSVRETCPGESGPDGSL